MPQPVVTQPHVKSYRIDTTSSTPDLSAHIFDMNVLISMAGDLKDTLKSISEFYRNPKAYDLSQKKTSIRNFIIFILKYSFVNKTKITKLGDN
jgi:hypothetical protein